MAIGSAAIAAGKAGLSSVTRFGFGWIRAQFARRGAEYADLAFLAGADRELEEAIAVLRGTADTVPSTIVQSVKAAMSQRPSAFADASARRFIEDDNVAALVKSGAVKKLRKEPIDDERAQARQIHADLVGGDGIYGEGLLEDAVNFAVMTLLGNLKPNDRLMLDLSAGGQQKAQAAFERISLQISNLESSTSVDVPVLDQAVLGEARKLRRLRFVLGDDLVVPAIEFSERLENGLRLASASARATGFREIAVVLLRAERPREAEPFIAKAAALGADTTWEQARLDLIDGDPDEAMRRLRDRNDPIARSLLIDAIQRRDGETAAITHYEDSYAPADLTGHALQAMALRLCNAGREADAEQLLACASQDQIDENPVLLLFRARLTIAGAMPKDTARRYYSNEGMIAQPSDLRDDEEGVTRLLAAREDFTALKSALEELGAADLLSLVDINILALDLNSSDPARRETVRNDLTVRLSDERQALELAPIAAVYGIDVNWSRIRESIDRAERLGGLDETQLRAAFALVMKSDIAQDIAHFIERYRNRLDEIQGHETVVAIDVEARSKSADVAGARQLLTRERNSLSPNVAAFLEATIAEAEGADSLTLRLSQFESSGATHDLQILISVMAQANDDRFGDYLVELWRRRHQIEDARRACDALISVGKEVECEAFLDELGEVARQDHYLHTHLAWARQRQGRLKDAAQELRAILDAGVDTPNVRHLTVMLAIESGRWSDLEPYCREQLAQKDHRSPVELMHAAQLALVLKRQIAMDIARAAIAKAPDDPLINFQGYAIALGLGLERTKEVNAWFACATSKSTEEAGPLRTADWNDVVKMAQEERTQSDKMAELVNSAQVPLFMALGSVRTTQSRLMLLRMADNAEQTDSRQKFVIPLFAGNRMLVREYAPQTIGFDPLALILLDHLGLLQSAIENVGEFVIPAGTMRSFFEDMRQSGPQQPSRIAQANDLKAKAAAGILSAQALPSSDVSLAVATGDEFSRLYEAAIAADGYVVATAPLFAGGEARNTVDPAPFAERLISPLGLIRSLGRLGTLSQASVTEAEVAMAGSGEPWDSEPEPIAGRPMFMAHVAVQYLADAGLLTAIKSYAGALVILPDVLHLSDQEIAAGEAAQKVRDGIERIRETLELGIAKGSIRVGPARLGRDERDQSMEGSVGYTPIMNAMRDAGGMDALVCDDRAMNKYGVYTDRGGVQVPFLTTVDMLEILRRTAAIDRRGLASAREKLRVAGAGLMPLDPNEIVEAALASNWAVGPNAELRAIRDSIHLPFARGILQLPEERPWAKSVCLSICVAIRRVWQDLEDVMMAERAASFLHSMAPDPEAWSAKDGSPDRALWVQDVSRHMLWALATVFDLPDDRVVAYHRWFNAYVGQAAARRDPGAMDAIARTAFVFLTQPLNEESVDGAV